MFGSIATFIGARLSVIAAVVLAVVAAYFVGDLRGAHRTELAHAHERLAAEAAYSDALTTLAVRYAQADAAAESARAEARALAKERVRRRNDTLATLPAVDCAVPADRRMLIRASHCARYPTGAACVSDSVPADAD